MQPVSEAIKEKNSVDKFIKNYNVNSSSDFQHYRMTAKDKPFLNEIFNFLYKENRYLNVSKNTAYVILDTKGKICGTLDFYKVDKEKSIYFSSPKSIYCNKMPYLDYYDIDRHDNFNFNDQRMINGLTKIAHKHNIEAIINRFVEIL